MRLITTCLRWELAEQPPIITELKSLSSEGPYLVLTYPDGQVEKVICDREMTYRVLA